MKFISDWLFGDAEWWQFWRPGSGIGGGAIMGVVVSILLWLLGVLK